MGGAPILSSAPVTAGETTPEGRRWTAAGRSSEGARGADPDTAPPQSQPAAAEPSAPRLGADPRIRVAEDGRLAGRVSRGDVEAFSRLVEAHSDLVVGVALRVLGARDVQDASQEVWIRVWRNIKGFRGDSAFTTWLYSIATNTCLGLRRNRARREEHQHYGETPCLPEPPGGDADPEACALNAERRAEIEAALGHVRAEHRAALVLRHMEGLCYAEIAEVLNVPGGTAKGWVSRGRDAMLVALTEGRRPSRPGPVEALGPPEAGPERRPPSL